MIEDLERLSDNELLDLLSYGLHSEKVDEQIKVVLRSRKVEFVDYNATKPSNNFNSNTVGAVLLVLLFLAIRIIRHFNN